MFPEDFRKSYRLLTPDETVATMIKTGSSGAFSSFALFSTIMLPLPVRQAGLRGNSSYIIYLACRHRTIIFLLLSFIFYLYVLLNKPED